MADRPIDRPLPPRRSSPPGTPATNVAGPARPLPARPLPERPLPARPLPERAPRTARPGTPDVRPMRVVYGASAVAAVGVIAAGLLQPVTTATTSGDPAAALPSGAPDPTAQSDGSGVVVRHVIQYIQLKPGQTAPPGAKVITPGAPSPRVVVTHNAPTRRTASAPAPRQPAPAPVRTRTSGTP